MAFLNVVCMISFFIGAGCLAFALFRRYQIARDDNRRITLPDARRIERTRQTDALRPYWFWGILLFLAGLAGVAGFCVV